MFQESKINDYSLHLTCVVYLCNRKSLLHRKRMIKQWVYLRWTWSVKLMSCTLQKGSNIFLARFKNYGIWIFLKVSDFLVANYRKCPVFFNSFDTWQAHVHCNLVGEGSCCMPDIIFHKSVLRLLCSKQYHFFTHSIAQRRPQTHTLQKG